MECVEYESGEPTCPDCGEAAEWIECLECKGVGLITCICEGMGGELLCTFNCDKLLDPEGYDL